MNPFSWILGFIGAYIGIAIGDRIGPAAADEPLAVDGKVVDQVEDPPPPPPPAPPATATGGAT